MQKLIPTAEAIVRARRDEVGKNDDGFTLIELLVVIAVIGILAAIVVFGVANFRSEATAAACQAAQTTVTTANEAALATGAAAAGDFSDLQAANYLKTGFSMPTGCALPAGVVA